METLFNETVAAGLQYVTFPLELIGLTLALIEVRFPALAANLTQKIEQLSAPIRDLRSDQSGSESLMERSLGLLLSRVLWAGYFILTAIYTAKLIYQLFERGPETSWLLGLLISYVVSGVIMTIAFCPPFRRRTRNRYARHPHCRDRSSRRVIPASHSDHSLKPSVRHGVCSGSESGKCSSKRLDS